MTAQKQEKYLPQKRFSKMRIVLFILSGMLITIALIIGVLATWDIRSEKSRTSKPLLNGEAEKCSGEQGERQHLLLLPGRKPGEGRQTATGILRWLSHFIHISSSSLAQMPSAVYAAL